MLGPSTVSGSRRLGPRLWLVASGWLALSAGCSLVPQAKLDESRRVSQTLRADNDRLKDVVLDLRTRNQDLSDRAVDDARRLAVQDEAIERLERSVVAYQSDREKIDKAFEAIKRQVRLAAGAALSPPAPARAPAPRFGPLKAFAEAHPGWSFEAATGTLSVAPDQLFPPSSATLKPDAGEALAAMASALGHLKDEMPGRDGLVVEILPPAVPPASPVVAAALRDDLRSEGEVSAPARFLAAARAVSVRDRIAADSGLEPGRVRLGAPADVARAESEAPPTVSIRVRETGRVEPEPAPALDSGTRHDP